MQGDFVRKLADPGVRAGLEACPDFKVIALDPATPDLEQEVAAQAPAALLFDTTGVRPDFPTVLFRQAGLLLIGIDPATHQALVWSGRHAAAVGTGDIRTIIQQGPVRMEI